ncbi:MAG: DNA repair protein RadC [Bacillota bacterium]|nr:DNA repair protein RadC [Bacillota bacterium]
MQERLRIKDLPLSERPYEKLEKFGPEMLSNAELLAIIIRTGSKNETSVSLSQRILSQDKEGEGLAFLHNYSVEQLTEINGVGKVKAIQIKALMELSKRAASTSMLDKKAVIKTPADVAALLMEEMKYYKKEVFKAVLLNTKNYVIRHINISIGSLNASVVHPREVFSEAVKAGCSCIVFAHNHPSGDPEPSIEDLETTARLVDAGNILGIKVLDHIIIGKNRFISFKEKGLL